MILDDFCLLLCAMNVCFKPVHLCLKATEHFSGEYFMILEHSRKPKYSVEAFFFFIHTETNLFQEIENNYDLWHNGSINFSLRN